jgi:hypothetical protein
MGVDPDGEGRGPNKSKSLLKPCFSKLAKKVLCISEKKTAACAAVF